MGRLVLEDTVRREGVEFVPMDARLARAVEVLSRANEANDLRLRLREMLAEAEWLW